MRDTYELTLAAAVNDPEVLEGNLLISPGVQHVSQVITKRDYPSASSAFNDCIAEAEHDLIIFAHQDIYFPKEWFSQLFAAIGFLNERNISWGVLGCYGTGPRPADQAGSVYQTGMGIVGRSIAHPEVVQSLDEIVLVIRKSSGLIFDTNLPHFHLYGADLCMTANARGMPCYAIPAVCIHNTNQIVRLPREYWNSYHYFRQKWRRSLPIQTSCIEISRYDQARWVRLAREWKSGLFGVRNLPSRRLSDPRQAIGELG